MVLGTDLLSQPALCPLKLDFQLGVFHLGTNLLPLSTNGIDFSPPDNKFTQKVHVSETTVIPPRCEVTLPGISSSLVTTRTQFLFEPDQERLEKLGIFATCTLLFPCKNFIICLRLLNTGFAPIRLYKGTTLGHLEPDVIQISTNSTTPVANT